MSKLLHIDSSPLGEQSVSRQLSAQISAAWVQAHPETQVEYLDLAVQAPSHLDQHSLALRLGLDEASLSDRQRAENEITEALLSQFLAADVVVVGAPMFNFSVPSQLKAWIDRVAQAGRTFKYTEAGPQGLAGGKKVFIVSSRGGAYFNQPELAFLEHQESYLQAVFGFLGITDVHIVRAERLGYGPEAKAESLAQAAREIQALVAG
jgi:FMN-dependent NADH-azoreductase